MEAYNKLWDILLTKRGTSVIENTLSYNSKLIFIELTTNDHYDYQVHIACNSGFTTISIDTLLNNKDSEYEWCWKQLNRLNIRRRMI